MTGRVSLAVVLYIGFLMVPVYWLIVMSLKSEREITGSFLPCPQSPSLDNFRFIFTDPAWYFGYINALI